MTWYSVLIEFDPAEVEVEANSPEEAEQLAVEKAKQLAINRAFTIVEVNVEED